MRPAGFDYQRATSVDEALELLSQDDATPLAGGHSLIPAMNLRLAQPATLVDIGRLDDLRQISVSGATVSVGALCTHAQIAASSPVRQHCPALATATGLVGDQQVRNWGTLGGNLAHADPASDPPTVAVAQDAVIHLRGARGSRTIRAADFFVDLFTTALDDGELITQVDFPSAEDERSAYLKLAHPASRYALVGVCVLLKMEGSVCRHARVAIGGATGRALRSPGAEAALIGSDLGEGALEEAAGQLQNDIGDDLIGEAFAPQEYRQAMAGIYLKQAVRQAVES